MKGQITLILTDTDDIELTTTGSAKDLFFLLYCAYATQPQFKLLLLKVLSAYLQTVRKSQGVSIHD